MLYFVAQCDFNVDSCLQAEDWNTEAVDTEDIEEEGGIYTITKTLPGLESGRYVVKARSKNANGYSDWSEYKFERGMIKIWHFIVFVFSMH